MFKWKGKVNRKKQILSYNGSWMYCSQSKRSQVDLTLSSLLLTKSPLKLTFPFFFSVRQQVHQAQQTVPQSNLVGLHMDWAHHRCLIIPMQVFGLKPGLLFGPYHLFSF